MTNLFKSWISLGAATALLIGASQAILPSAANAADMLESEGETLVEFGTGWYLRGDIGGGVTSLSAQSNLVDGEIDLGTPISVNLAAGYDAGDGYRYEFGLSQHTNLSFAGRNSTDCGSEEVTSVLTGSTVTNNITGSCFLSINGDLTTSSATASAFKDFQEVRGFTPYVGVGAGFTYLSSNDMRWLTVCEGASDPDCGSSGGIGPSTLAQGEYTENSAFSLTANAMVGASYNISENTKLDFGYKYTYIGTTTVAKASANAYNQQDLDLDSLNIHEIRVGLRYAIW